MIITASNIVHGRPANGFCVDATIIVDGVIIGDVTLAPQEDGRFDVWGDDWSCWASSEIQTWLLDLSNLGPDGEVHVRFSPRGDAIADLVEAVNDAAGR